MSWNPNEPGMRPLPAADCEYTAPGATTEAVDCWEPATRRHVGTDGVTRGVYCEEHTPRLSSGESVEFIEQIGG